MWDMALPYTTKAKPDELHFLCALQSMRLMLSRNPAQSCVSAVIADSVPEHQLRYLEREKLFLFKVIGLIVSLVTRRGEKKRWSNTTEMDSAGRSPHDSP